MSLIGHKLYIFLFAAIIAGTAAFLAIDGFSYYKTSKENRFYHARHELLKPSGNEGHGLGIIGSAIILTGVFTYMARKRIRKLNRLGVLKYWLEFHIFLCILGPTMILFHTSFKFGGIVAVSFWCMVAVLLSGVIGRFIYLQIPRTLQGRELSLNEVNLMKNELAVNIKSVYGSDGKLIDLLADFNKNRLVPAGRNILSEILIRSVYDRRSYKSIRLALKKLKLARSDYKNARRLLKSEIVLNRRIDMLVSMQNLFRYWHVAHLPFAMVMLIIMIIHVSITVVFGYHWIF